MVAETLPATMDARLTTIANTCTVDQFTKIHILHGAIQVPFIAQHIDYNYNLIINNGNPFRMAWCNMSLNAAKAVVIYREPSATQELDYSGFPNKVLT